jgi:queuosine precursor transporter
MRTFRYLDLITASFVAVLLISNIASTKILDLKWFTFDGGTILFPLAYIFGDILTEVYGYARSRRVIWTGFIWIAVAAGIFYLVDRLPAASEYEMSDSFHAILGQTPRIVAGSLAAYFVGEFVNSVILAKLKVWSAGRMLWARTISSTLFGQGVDTAIFLLIAFGGVFTNATLWEIFKSNYVFKVGVEVAFTPITYLVVRYLKRVERSDVYDRDTDFNPFILTTSQAPAD